MQFFFHTSNLYISLPISGTPYIYIRLPFLFRFPSLRASRTSPTSQPPAPFSYFIIFPAFIFTFPGSSGREQPRGRNMFFLWRCSFVRGPCVFSFYIVLRRFLRDTRTPLRARVLFLPSYPACVAFFTIPAPRLHLAFRFRAVIIFQRAQRNHHLFAFIQLSCRPVKYEKRKASIGPAYSESLLNCIDASFTWTMEQFLN